MPYNLVHRYFLRNLMCKGVLSEREAQRVLQRCSDVHQDLSEIISEINMKIRPLQQDIKRVRHEITGEYKIVILWTGLGEAALSQGLYSQNDVLYWRKLLEEIAVSDKKKIGAIDALNLCSGMNITKTRAQDLMNEWTVAQYLEKIDDGYYVLGVRGIHEFEPYLRQNLPDTLDSCVLCTKSVFQSKQCNHCSKYFHHFCLSTAKDKMRVWPCCKNEYKEDESIEEQQTEHVLNGSTSENVDMTQDSSDEEMNMSKEF